MNVFKKKLVQRLSCVCCAVAFAIFSVFSVCGFSRSKNSEVISASAENFPVYTYDIIIPSGMVFITRHTGFMHENSSFKAFYITSDVSSFTSTIATLPMRSTPSYFEALDVTDSPYSYISVKPVVLPIDFDYCTEELFIELSNLPYDNSLYPIYIDAQYSYEQGYLSSSWCVYFSSPFVTQASITMISEQSISQPIYIRQNGVYTQSDINSALNDGYNGGYDAGYSTGVEDTREEAFDDGYNVGVKDGKEEAEDKFKRGLFSSFESIEVRAYDSSDKYLFSIEADYGVNAVSFNTAFLEYEYMIEKGELTIPAYYKILFATEHGYEYEIPLEMLEIIAYGDSSLFGQENSFVGQGSDYYTQTWRSYPMYFDTSVDSEGYPLVIDYNNNDPHLSRARLNNFAVIVPNLSLLRNLQFVASSGYYNQGYMQGVVDGYEGGLIEGEKIGYDKGYIYGKDVGYNQGAEDAGEFTFLGLFTSVIDAPIKAMVGLLDFEILGMDMQKFFLSILSAALIISVYRLFTGGGL